MATITTLGASDDGATSRTTINTNFTNLNTDKIEADSSDTLTNKTIDGDDNTLSDIGTASLKTKTGSDASVVTGTAGTSGNLAQWNADGDVVDSSVAVDTDGTLAGNSDSSIPTEKAVKTYADTKLQYGAMCVVFDFASGGVANQVYDAGPHADYVLNSSADYIGYQFILPPTATGVQSATMVVTNVNGGNAAFEYDVSTTMGGASAGDEWDQHTESASNITTGTVADHETVTLDLTQYFTAATGGDKCQIVITHSGAGGEDFAMGTLVVEYTI